ncbi:6-carboxy-5,6,7,8-tetrahydropterin synthase [Vibrio phage vB_VibM_83AMN]|nr:6-carboxy-5,6,7,8-tetrahydropterin synthase [Vibrio phage vB_VibM_83AMN]
MKTQAHRYHDISVGHRVVGHESKCRHLHGHNYRIHFYCEALEEPCKVNAKAHIYSMDHKCIKCGHEYNSSNLDSVGRVIDFSVIKDKLCLWLENNWDHKFLHWENDLILIGLAKLANNSTTDWGDTDYSNFINSLVEVPFNPTAENMAQYLISEIAPKELSGLGVVCTKIIIEETAKCAVTVEL